MTAPTKERKARVTGRGATRETIARYLPDNYRVTSAEVQDRSSAEPYPVVYIAGRDQAGWTLDGYVIPRLRSGMFFAREL